MNPDKILKSQERLREIADKEVKIEGHRLKRITKHASGDIVRFRWHCSCGGQGQGRSKTRRACQYGFARHAWSMVKSSRAMVAVTIDLTEDFGDIASINLEELLTVRD